MVIFRVLVVLVSLGAASLEAAPLRVKLDKTTSLLGEPVHLRVTSSTPLNEIDLTPLTKDFEVFSQLTNSSVSEGREQSLLEVTLYPLHTGKLVLPSLTQGTAHSAPLPIEIGDSIVSLIAWVPPAIPMEREATNLYLEIRDDGSLTWDTPIQLDAPFITLLAYPEWTKEEKREEGMQVVHHFRWRVLPLRSGSLSLRFGMLDAHKFGHHLRFPLNSISLQVRAAPAYLPLELPMGKPTIRADAPPPSITVGQPMAWNLYIQAPGLSPEGVLKLLQYTHSPGLRFYTPNVTPVSLDGEEGLRLTLSFVGDNTAQFFPAFQLPYFDVGTQRIEAWSMPASRLVAKSPVRDKMVIGTFLIVASLVLVGLGYRAWRSIERLQIKRAWLRQIQSSADPIALYRAVTRDAPWHGQTVHCLPLTLYVTRELCEQLEQAAFALSSPQNSFDAIRQAWLHACTKMSLSNFNPPARLGSNACLPT